MQGKHFLYEYIIACYTKSVKNYSFKFPKKFMTHSYGKYPFVYFLQIIMEYAQKGESIVKKVENQKVLCYTIK